MLHVESLDFPGRLPGFFVVGVGIRGRRGWVCWSKVFTNGTQSSDQFLGLLGNAVGWNASVVGFAVRFQPSFCIVSPEHFLFAPIRSAMAATTN